MDIQIRPAVPGDLARILEMMADFAGQVSLRDQLRVTEQRLSAAVFGENAFVELLVAAENGQLLAYAIYYPHFSSFRGEQGFYLEDIFVSEPLRGRGIGIEMLRFIAKKARERGFDRIDFQVLRTNASAMKFYERLGAEVNREEFRLKIAGPAFERLSD